MATRRMSVREVVESLVSSFPSEFRGSTLKQSAGCS